MGAADDEQMLLDTLAEALEDRHQSVRSIGKWFAFDHLRGNGRLASAAVCRAAVSMLLTIPDGPELTAGLRKLLEAKDCLVRAAMEAAGEV